MLERNKGNTPPLLVGVQTYTANLEISMASSQKTGNQSTSGPLLGIYPKDAQSYHKDTCSNVFIAALFIIARTWKQPSCPSNKKWIRQMWYNYTCVTQL